MSRTPPRACGPRHPLNSDRDEILASLGRRPQAVASHLPPLSRPLEGIRVIDVTQVLAGPTAARILAELGADVVKINQPPDDMRRWGGSVAANPMMGHLHVNSGKRTALIDLTNERGRALLWPLVERADVFLQNFALGVAERIGIGEEEVRARRPDIVYGSLSAYGREGPRAGHRGWEPLGQATTGMLLRQGRGKQRAARYTLCDYGSGHLLAFAVLLALRHRARTGEGQHVQSSLVQAGTYHQIPYTIDDDRSGPEDCAAVDSRDRLLRAGDHWICVSGADVERSGASEKSNAKSFHHSSAATWATGFHRSGIAAHVVYSVEEAMGDEEVCRRGLSVTRDHPCIGRVRLVGVGHRLQRTPARLATAAPLPGWDTQSVVEEAGQGHLFEELEAAGVVASATAGPAGPRRRTK